MSPNGSFEYTHSPPRSGYRWLTVWMLAMLLALLVVFGLSVGASVASAQTSTIDVKGTWQAYFGDNVPLTVTLRQSGRHIDGEIVDLDQTKLGTLVGDIGSDGAINLDILWYKIAFAQDIPLPVWQQAVAERGDPTQQTLRSTLTVRPNAAGDELTGTYVFLTIKYDSGSGTYQGINEVPDRPVRFKKIAEEFPWILVVGAIGAGVLGAGVTADQIRKRKYRIRIYLVDQAGNKIANEPFRITTPDGKVLEGRLNKDGMAEARGSKAGECKVSFPELDASDWGPIGTE